MKVFGVRYAFAALVIFVILSACTLGPTAIHVHFASPTPAKEINIAATTELKFALPEIADAFQQRTGNKVK